jgi:hypothetical protein
MYDPAPGACQVPENPDPLARADALEREITDLCAQINAAGYRLLQLVAELDDEAPWGAWGLSSCAHWLNWRCGIGLNAAREKVRVAHALRQLPRTSLRMKRNCSISPATPPRRRSKSWCAPTGASDVSKRASRQKRNMPRVNCTTTTTRTAAS